MINWNPRCKFYIYHQNFSGDPAKENCTGDPYTCKKYRGDIYCPAKKEADFYHKIINTSENNKDTDQKLGEENMSFKFAPYNTTIKVEGEDSLVGLITGKNDVVFNRNKYQKELDNANAALVNMVHYTEQNMRALKDAYDNSQRLKKNIEAHLEERKTLFQSLDDLLNNEKGHEKEMWFETLKSRVQETKDRNITITQRNKDSDIDSMNLGSSFDYPKQYPDSKIKQRYEKILTDIECKEKEVRNEKEKYYSEVAKYNNAISFFEKDIQKSEDKFRVYDDLLKEGTQKIQNCRYHGGYLYNFSSEKSKDEMNLNTLTHRVEQFRNTLNLIKRDLSQYQSKKFVELEY
jgi:hypothetical protein